MAALARATLGSDGDSTAAGYDNTAVTSGGAASLRVQYVKMEVGGQGYAGAHNELCNDTLPAMTHLGFVLAGATYLDPSGRIASRFLPAESVYSRCGLRRHRAGRQGDPGALPSQPPSLARLDLIASDAFFVSPEATLPAPPVPADEWPSQLDASTVIKSASRGR